MGIFVETHIFMYPPLAFFIVFTAQSFSKSQLGS